MKEETASTPARVRQPHFKLFDGMRAFAAVLIVILHTTSQTGSDQVAGSGALFARLDVAVTIFFVISGFLLYRPFVSDHLTGRPSGSLRSFYWRRALRILPAYWILVTFAWLVFGTIAISSPRDFVVVYGLFWPYSATWVFQFAGIFTVWSLAVELAFYAVLPLYAAVMARLVARSRRPVTAELLGAVAVVVVGFGVYSWNIWTRAGGSVSSQWLPAQMQYFGLGMVLAVIHAAGTSTTEAVGRRLGSRPLLAWVVGMAALAAAAWGIGLPHGNFFAPVSPRQHLAQELLYCIVAVAVLLPAIFGPDDAGRIRRFLANPAVAFVGLVSYGVFLWHDQFVTQFLEWNVPAHLPVPHTFWLCVLVLIVSIATATVSWYGVERPILRLKSRGPSRRRTPTS